MEIDLFFPLNPRINDFFKNAFQPLDRTHEHYHANRMLRSPRPELLLYPHKWTLSLKQTSRDSHLYSPLVCLSSFLAIVIFAQTMLVIVATVFQWLIFA